MARQPRKQPQSNGVAAESSIPARRKPAVLDRTKPYGEVYGIHHAKYEQDGKLFNASDREIVDDTEAVAEEAEVEVIDEAVAPAAEPAPEEAGTVDEDALAAMSKAE